MQSKSPIYHCLQAKHLKGCSEPAVYPDIYPVTLAFSGPIGRGALGIMQPKAAEFLVKQGCRSARLSMTWDKRKIKTSNYHQNRQQTTALESVTTAYEF